MSESKLAVQPAQTHTPQAEAPDKRAEELRQLTELELMHAGGGDTVSPWP